VLWLWKRYKRFDCLTAFKQEKPVQVRAGVCWARVRVTLFGWLPLCVGVSGSGLYKSISCGSFERASVFAPNICRD
jgi:hypothetical protein